MSCLSQEVRRLGVLGKAARVRDHLASGVDLAKGFRGR